ncbi:helix-turn-helix domain-containing protein, partial [Streptococcus suis]|nr:helix-turn-helix domain-containing protein [Streptococcus suis]
MEGRELELTLRIYRWKNENMSNRAIAGLLGKAPQTINNEVNRGTTLQ